ncbi:hypothetical protein F5148DRAFT_1290133 [Russula earlei]|uniref:Uncharacterized protein n=1 Tax=Russula earlei TaxID=71964 RepID=A0ACC0TY02_9AGAM|nr:hypothetical protein F5148DRAFT_1290133 [Russula earlei]
MASVDHINAALQWTSTELLAGQWLWHDLITLMLYDAELTCTDPTSLRGSSTGRAQSSSEGAAATAHADDTNSDNGGDNDGDGGEAHVGGHDAPSMQAVLLANMAVRGGMDLTTPASTGKVAIAYNMHFNLAWEFQFLYKPLTTLQLPPFSTINKPPCLALLPPLLNNLRLLHIKLSVLVTLWAVLNSIGHLLAPQLPDNLFNFKDKSIITYQLIWLLKWLPFNQCLLLHNSIDKLLPLLFLPLLLSHSAAPGSGSTSAAAASIYGSHSGSVSTPDLATNPRFPLPHPNRQYQHLPADLATQLAALPPPQQQRGQHVPAPAILTAPISSSPSMSRFSLPVPPPQNRGHHIPAPIDCPVNLPPAPAPAPAPPTPSPPSSPVPSPPPSPSSAPPSPLPYPHAQVYPEDPLPQPQLPPPQAMPMAQRPFDPTWAIHDLKDLTIQCSFCKALHWLDEHLTNSSKRTPKFGMCCLSGKIALPALHPCPPELYNLLTGQDPTSKAFCLHILSYNNALAFTSVGRQVDHSVYQGQGPWVFKLHGELIHRIGSLLPPEGPDAAAPSYAQLYIYDPDQALHMRMAHPANSHLHQNTMQTLQDMLHYYNAPDAAINEIAAIIPGDGDEPRHSQDIILHLREGPLQRISDTHPFYPSLRYVLLFPTGQLGWFPNIPYQNVQGGPAQRKLTVELSSSRARDKLEDESIDVQDSVGKK